MGCRWVVKRGWAEMRGEECSPATVSGDRKRPTFETGYTAAIVNRWGVKRTPNAMKLDRRSIYTIIRPHVNSHPIPRTFSGHL